MENTPYQQAIARGLTPALRLRRDVVMVGASAGQWRHERVSLTTYDVQRAMVTDLAARADWENATVRRQRLARLEIAVRERARRVPRPGRLVGFRRSPS